MCHKAKTTAYERYPCGWSETWSWWPLHRRCRRTWWGVACPAGSWSGHASALQAEGGSGWQLVTWLTGIPSWFKCTYCANGQVTTFKMRHDFVILCILQKEDDSIFVCYFHIIHLYKQTMNQTKYLAPLLLPLNNQEKSIYEPKSIGHFSPLMLSLAVCQLNTS